MGQAIFAAGLALDRNGGIYRWKKYDIKNTTTYTWNRWNAVETVTYKWNKWGTYEEHTSTKYNTKVTHTFNREVHLAIAQLIVSRSYKQVFIPVIDEFEETFSYGIYGYELVTPIISISAMNAVSYVGYFFTGDSSNPTTSTSIYMITGGYTSGTVPASLYTLETSQGTKIGTVKFDEYISPGYLRPWVDGYWYDTIQSYVYKDTNSYIGTVTSIQSNAYPANGDSGSYWYESAGSTSSWSKGTTKYSDVSSTNSSAYPNGGRSGSYWYDNRTSSTSQSIGTYIGYVYSTVRGLYPENGIKDGYWYVFEEG